MNFNDILEELQGIDEKQAQALLKELERMVPEEKKPRKSLKSRVMNALFYGMLIAVVAGAALLSGNGTGPRNFLGYSAMIVLSGSMHDVMPEDSLIITHKIEAESIMVGDDIAFLQQDGTVVSHRVISKEENGFRTQGTNNPSPDRDIVAPANVIGRVVFISYPIGRALVLMRSNLLYIAVFMVMALLIIAFILALKAARKPRFNQSKVSV